MHLLPPAVRIQPALDFIRYSDTLIVTKLDRFARSTLDLLARGVTVEPGASMGILGAPLWTVAVIASPGANDWGSRCPADGRTILYDGHVLDRRSLGAALRSACSSSATRACAQQSRWPGWRRHALPAAGRGVIEVSGRRAVLPSHPARIPPSIARTFTPQQLAAIELAFGARQWGDHPIDLRRSFGIGRWRFYIVLLMGRARRGKDVRRQA